MTDPDDLTGAWLPDPARFGALGCTCRPFTTDPPRFLDQPGDTVGRDASWQRGTDCPHHAPEAERDEDAPVAVDFDRNPAALAWARGKVQDYLDRLAEFEQQAEKNRNAVMAYSCGVARALTTRHFLGDDSGTIGTLGERLAGHKTADSTREQP